MKGEKHYPKDILATFNYITNYQGDRTNVEFCSEEMYFMNVASKNSTEADVNQPPWDSSNRTCCEYGENGHIEK